MSLQQFDIYRSEGSKMDYLSLKEFKFELNSEFKTIVSVTLEVLQKKLY
jgi:hypothetical protein